MTAPDLLSASVERLKEAARECRESAERYEADGITPHWTENFALAAAALEAEVRRRETGAPPSSLHGDYDWERVRLDLDALQTARETGWLKWAAEQAAEHYYNAGPDQDEFEEGMNLLRRIAGSDR